MKENIKPELKVELVEDPPHSYSSIGGSDLCIAGAKALNLDVKPRGDCRHGEAPAIRTPQSVVIDGVLKALPFVVIPLLIVLSTQVFPSPFIVPIHASAGIRTLLMCAFIWNLIGAVLYAQANTRLSKALLVAVFATPLATIHIWGIVILSLIIVLKATFPGPNVW